MKVTLVYPRLNQSDFGSGSIHMPLGILYLASYLRKHHIAADIIDCTFYRDWDEYLNKLRLNPPDIIGFSFSSPMAGMAFEAIRLTGKNFPEIMIVCGGPHSTVDPENTIRNEHVDVAVIGEGEKILLQLCRAYRSGKREFGHIGRVYFKNDAGKTIKSEAEAPFMEDLDSIPPPDRNLLDIKKYISATGKVTVSTSRGCPGRCNFCQPALRRLFGNKIRAHSPEYVIEDLLAIKKNYYRGDFLVEIIDDTFTFDKRRALEICRRINSAGLARMPWWCISRVDFLDEDLARTLRESGCIGLSLGVESGSNRILNEVMKKGIDTETIKKAFALCHRHRLITVAYFMLGNPTETREDLELTRSLLRRIHPDVVAVSITTPIIGSELYEQARQEKKLNISDFSDYGYYGTRSPMKLEFLSEDDVIAYKKKLVRAWFLGLGRNLIKYIPFFLSPDRARLVHTIMKRSLKTRFKWARWKAA